MMLEVNKKSKMGGICPSFLSSYFDGCMVHGFMLNSTHVFGKVCFATFC